MCYTSPPVQIYAQIPDTDVKFSAQHKEESNDISQPIRGVFTISERIILFLQGGQALITFEEEKGTFSTKLRDKSIFVCCHSTTTTTLRLHALVMLWSLQHPKTAENHTIVLHWQVKASASDNRLQIT